MPGVLGQAGVTRPTRPFYAPHPDAIVKRITTKEDLQAAFEQAAASWTKFKPKYVNLEFWDRITKYGNRNIKYHVTFVDCDKHA